MAAEAGLTAFDPDNLLGKAAEVILPTGRRRAVSSREDWNGNLHIGVDLGTAYLVLSVLSLEGIPLAGQYRFAQVVKDGLVVDYIGAVDMLREMKRDVEDMLGVELTHASSGYPPGVPQAEIRATAHVVEAAGMRCTGLIDEPSAANNVLSVQNGVIVDVGGGTTGIAVLKDGKVIYTADEPTGGTHFSLVIAGALDIPFEEAERLKLDPLQQPRLFPLIRPVMEKVGSIINRHLNGYSADQILLVGGACAFPGMAGVIQDYTGRPTRLAAHPMLVTPLGIAMHDRKLQE